MFFFTANNTGWYADRFGQLYSNLVQRCFNDCVTDFTSKSLAGKEEGCVLRCVDKFLKSSERLSERFQEQNAAMAQSGGMGGMGR
jgi:mitochondrial import inner membrane translocase subunit TIM9